MDIRNGRSARDRRFADRQPTEEQAIERFRTALMWRDIWRAETLSGHGLVVDDVPPGEAERARLRRFAQGMARAEFGRAYWDERLQRGAGERRGA